MFPNEACGSSIRLILNLSFMNSIRLSCFMSCFVSVGEYCARCVSIIFHADKALKKWCEVPFYDNIQCRLSKLTSYCWNEEKSSHAYSLMLLLRQWVSIICLQHLFPWVTMIQTCFSRRLREKLTLAHLIFGKDMLLLVSEVWQYISGWSK